MFRTTARPGRRRAFAVGCLTALGIAAAAVPAAAASTAATGERYTAEEIHTFLEDFYGEHGPGGFARKYGISPHLKEKVRPTRSSTSCCARRTSRRPSTSVRSPPPSPPGSAGRP
ncbi:hypothetical protein [Streptomyces coeruleorubidus]